ncbi:MAG TPA: amidohydrolase, partial [Chromatiaceae bacterium]|nr:amidohydrolase [Chromatiaceae bacterium]
ILEQNPFKIDPVKIKDIPIVGIVYKGKLKLNKGKQIGGDRDAHGCIGSAGYSWCEKTGSCERPWELAKKHDFENTKAAFDIFCGNPDK